MIVSLLVMELFKKKDRPVSNNHPVDGNQTIGGVCIHIFNYGIIKEKYTLYE